MACPRRGNQIFCTVLSPYFIDFSFIPTLFQNMSGLKTESLPRLCMVLLVSNCIWSTKMTFPRTLLVSLWFTWSPHSALLFSAIEPNSECETGWPHHQWRNIAVRTIFFPDFTWTEYPLDSLCSTLLYEYFSLVQKFINLFILIHTRL